MENNYSNDVIELLDKTIATTTDLYVLNILLDLKLSISKTPFSKKINFIPSFILANETVDFDLQFATLKKSFQVCEDLSKLIQDIIEYILVKCQNINNQCIIIELLNYLLSFCVKNSKAEIISTNFKPEFLCDFLIQALNNTKIKAHAYETLNLYFTLCSKADQIKCLNAVFEFCCHNNNLDIFCALLNYIPKDSIYSESCCFNIDNFWIYVESCISGSESHLQKQGQYILLKYIHSVTDVSLVNHICISKDFENTWQAFIILCDIGREKQLHLVVPSLSLFKYICKLPFLWQKCIYKIYLGHSQTTIVYQVAISILKRRFARNELKEIFKILLPATNNNEYTDLSSKMFRSLHIFCAGLNKDELDIVIKELLIISWTSVGFWKVIQNVFTFENKRNINVDLFQEIIRCALNLPHVYIRTECVKYIIRIVWDENNYKMCKLIYSVILLHKINIQYLKNYRRSKEVVDLAIKDLLQLNDAKQATEIYFLILKCGQINIWSYFQKNLNMLSPHAALCVWDSFFSYSSTMTVDSTVFCAQIETFLLNYFSENLVEETTDIFIDLFKLFAAKYLLSTNLISEVIDKPVFSSGHYNSNQIFTALVLIQDFLFKEGLYSDIKMSIKEKNGVILMYISKNNNIMNNIELKDSRLSIECINLIFELNNNEISIDDTKSIIGVFTQIFESHDNKVLYNIYGKLCNLLISSKCTNLVIDFISVCHKNLLHIKKDQYFKNIVYTFIKVIYSKIYLKHHSNLDSINNDLLELSESYPLIRVDWIRSLQKLCMASSIHHEFCIMPVFLIYLQGVIITKNERTEFNVCQEFLKDRKSIGTENEPMALRDLFNPNLLNAASRLLALETLLCIGCQNVELLINHLRERYMQHFKKRYFPDSKIHYEKLRIVQALLVTVSALEISEECAKTISSFVFECIQEETNQNCVKQFLNWILILTLKQVSPVLEWIESRPTNMSPSILISIIPTLYHLTLFGNEQSVENVVRMALPWTMGAQFKLRLYAQDLIRRLFEHARQKKYECFLNKYSYLEESIISCIVSTGDMFVYTMKSDILFLNNFHPIKQKSLLTIYYDIPRLNKVNPTEWKNIHFLILDPAVLQGTKILQKKISLQPSNSTFSEAVNQFLNNDALDDGQEVEDQGNSMLHIQKKITPWKSALENVGTEVNTDFILIASLIDKAQNLGGLSRTCEVFGIGSIVFNDAKVINNKEYKSLSMSSEVWINAIEVKVKDLVDYILTLQSKEYCVIGAEQTAGSNRLNEFQFPRKVALLLGNEKTGIPADIIPLLNVCLEIPQIGQIRSLNVHVAGATFIWEYAKQHLV